MHRKYNNMNMKQRKINIFISGFKHYSQLLYQFALMFFLWLPTQFYSERNIRFFSVHRKRS